MPQPDQARTWTAIALAESGGRSTNVPFVFVTVEDRSPVTPVGEDSRGLWQINLPPEKPAGAHVAISLGDGGTVEAIEIEVLAPPVFDLLL
jgi:hypothetical protein